MEIILYTFEDRDGQPVDFKSFHTFDEANDYAQVHALRLIQETYEYTDSVILHDFTVEPHEHYWIALPDGGSLNWLRCRDCDEYMQTVG